MKRSGLHENQWFSCNPDLFIPTAVQPVHYFDYNLGYCQMSPDVRRSVFLFESTETTSETRPDLGFFFIGWCLVLPGGALRPLVRTPCVSWDAGGADRWTQ